jgi:hypothetical protein
MKKETIMEMTKLHDCNGKNIPYNAPIRFCWWYRGLDGSEHEYFYKAKIRKRKSGDIFEFYENEDGDKIYFTHRLTAINWSEADLELLT